MYYLNSVTYKFSCFKTIHEIDNKRFDHVKATAEAVAQRFSVKNVFLEISQNSQENT